jgi:hypothetical protein
LQRAASRVRDSVAHDRQTLELLFQRVPPAAENLSDSGLHAFRAQQPQVCALRCQRGDDSPEPSRNGWDRAAEGRPERHLLRLLFREVSAADRVQRR